MSLLRVRPYGNLFNLGRDFERLFADNVYPSERELLEKGFCSPKTDIYEDKDKYVFSLEVPGVKKENINIEFNENLLTVSGQKEIEKELKEENFYRIERGYGKFSRSFSVPRDVDVKGVEAHLQDGVLTLVMPKIEEQKAKSIEIKVK